MPGDYFRIIREIRRYPLSEFLSKEIPGIRFAKEKGEWGTEYLKAKCFMSQSISKVPTFYIDKVNNLFFCYDCGAIGGLVNLLYEMGLDDAKAFRKIEDYISIKESLSEDDKKSILTNVWKDEDLAKVCFCDTYLEDRELQLNGRWRRKVKPEIIYQPGMEVKF